MLVVFIQDKKKKSWRWGTRTRFLYSVLAQCLKILWCFQKQGIRTLRPVAVLVPESRRRLRAFVRHVDVGVQPHAGETLRWAPRLFNGAILFCQIQRCWCWEGHLGRFFKRFKVGIVPIGRKTWCHWVIVAQCPSTFESRRPFLLELKLVRPFRRDLRTSRFSWHKIRFVLLYSYTKQN